MSELQEPADEMSADDFHDVEPSDLLPTNRRHLPTPRRPGKLQSFRRRFIQEFAVYRTPFSGIHLMSQAES